MARDTSLLRLNRPEYPPSRELFISELVWSMVRDRPASVEASGPGSAGYAYRELSSKVRAGIVITRPKPGSEVFEKLRDRLAETLGIRDSDEAAMAVDVLLEELEAPYSTKAMRSAATPLSLETALLQDSRGITGKSNPANLALILEQMYALGGGQESVATRWAGAVRNAGDGGLPGWCTDVFAAMAPPDLEAAAQRLREGGTGRDRDSLRRPRWFANGNTPYSWFATAWDNLCTNGWIDGMPRRRWTDWAVCVARTALATGYMFEMHLYRKLCAALVTTVEADDVVRQMLDDSSRLFSWDDLLQRSAADVGPTINRLAAAGTASMRLFGKLAEENELGFPVPADFDEDENGLSAWLSAARHAAAGIDDLTAQVAAALEAKRAGGANNTWEMIRYSLLARSGEGTQDLYAMLRSGGRYTWVEPGQEWLVTVSSLEAAGPGQVSRLTDLHRALSALGVDASHRTLVSRLEGYGLARSSHDADDALEIMSGF